MTVTTTDMQNIKLILVYINVSLFQPSIIFWRCVLKFTSLIKRLIMTIPGKYNRKLVEKHTVVQILSSEKSWKRSLPSLGFGLPIDITLPMSWMYIL
jgi:hypothetical protein